MTTDAREADPRRTEAGSRVAPNDSGHATPDPYELGAYNANRICEFLEYGTHAREPEGAALAALLDAVYQDDRLTLQHRHELLLPAVDAYDAAEAEQRRRTRESLARATEGLDVPCPRCIAQPGERCRAWPSGDWAASTHRDRLARSRQQG